MVFLSSPGWDTVNMNEELKMSDNENCEVVDLKEIRMENKLDEMKVLLANLYKTEDELLARENEYMLAFTQLSKSEQEKQRAGYMDFLMETERIKKDRRGVFGTGKRPSEELWLKIRAAFEANDVETLEEIEKKLLK